MQVPSAKMQICGDVGCVMEAEVTDFITSWPGHVDDRMITGYFLTSSVNTLMDRVQLLRRRQVKCGSQGSLGEHNNPVNNRHCYFFYLMNGKLES